ncbi:MAG: ABC transporter permease [Alphaproteobacteria bacterium]
MSAPAEPRKRRYPLSASDVIGGAVLYLLAGFSLLLLVGPSLIVIGISVTEKLYISFPPVGFTLRWYTEIWDKQQLIDSALVSLRVALWVTAVTLALGLPAAFSLVRGRYRGRTALSAFMVAPQMMPGMVIGIAVLFFGSSFFFYQSDLMLTLALAVFCLPFMVRVVMARLAGVDPTFEEASANLGASRTQTFLRVTLPQITPGLLAAGVFVFIESFDNITVALFTASPRGRPLSVELYTLVQFDSSPIVAAISSLEILLALFIVLVIARTIGLDKIRG